jgi:hypothetical protein
MEQSKRICANMGKRLDAPRVEFAAKNVDHSHQDFDILSRAFVVKYQFNI